MFGITELTFDFLTGQPLLTALFLILVILLSIYLYRRTNPPLSKAVRIVLSGLRIIAIVALFLALMEPVLSYKREYQRKPRLTLLVDRSKSMEIAEDGMSRSERVDSLLASERFNGFSSDFDVRVEHFAAGLKEPDEELDIDKTSLGEALEELAGKETAELSEGWMLLSDGISNSGISPVEVASRLKAPVYAVGVGAEVSEKDIAVAGLDYNQIVFAGKPTSVTVHLEWQGMNNEDATIEIRSGEKVMVTKKVQLPQGNLKDEIEMKFAPEKPGQQTFRLVVPESEDELSRDNNSRSFSMTVLKSKMNVLLVADRLDWEYSFLQRFLSNSESIDLAEVIYRKGGGYLTGQFPSQQAELNRFDLIVMYDVDVRLLRSRKSLFESYLEDKGGSILAMLGENYLKSSFPRWLDDYLPFVSVGKDADLIFVKYNGRPVENYLFHPAVSISENRQSIRESWQNLPHFEALVPVDSVAPNSEILVTADIGRNLSDQPIVGYRNFGGGRVLAIGALPFWHWAFFGYGFGDDDREYRRFFGGIVNWLSVREDSDPVRIVPDKTVYTGGETIGFGAYVYDLGFRPISGASGYIALADEHGRDTSISQLVESGDGRYRAEFDLLPPGRYGYTGVVEKEGKKMKETSGQIAIEAFSIEEYQRRPDFGRLSTISQITGGNFYRIGNSDSMYSDIRSDKITVSTQKEVILWNKFWLLSLFILALAAEWLLRKRYQLI